MNASFTPKKDKQHQETHPTIKVSPVKVPTGAKQIGNYILGIHSIMKEKRLEAEHTEKSI